MKLHITTASPLGDLLLVADETHLLGVYFAGEKHAPDTSSWTLGKGQPVLERAAHELGDYLAGRCMSFSVPFRFQGTSFQQEIWKRIADIPFGETISYTELARRAGAPEAIRAAGAATGRNPISIIVPCHRVMGKSGALHGFAGGLERKRYLLELEQAV